MTHGQKDCIPNRRIGEDGKQKPLQRLQEHHWEQRPTPGAEVEEKVRAGGGRPEMKVGRETVRKWLVGARLWRPKRAKVKQMHGAWARPGQWAEWEISKHDEMKERGPLLKLSAMINDATSKLTARFALGDSTAEKLGLEHKY